MIAARLFSVLALCGAVLAMPQKRADAPYDVPTATLAAALNCPNGIKNNNPILLVHGTGSAANESWPGTPYLLVLPQSGYDVCTVDLPNHSIGDAQVSSEYVAYNIGQLSKLAGGAQISVIGHSQGNLNIQWALNFWPSTRPMVKHFFSLAGDFHGTGEGIFACAAEQALEQGCFPSLWQQDIGSNFLNALNKHGNTALVDTISLFTIYDDVIQPENPRSSATSVVPNALSLAVQDLCTPAHPADHFTMLIDAVAYNVVTQVLANGKFDATTFNYASCVEIAGVPGAMNGTAYAGDVRSAVEDVLRLATAAVVKSEPPLMAYAANQA